MSGIATMADAEAITLQAAETGLFTAPAERKRELLLAYGALILAGERPSLRAAARAAGIPPGTPGPWAKRDANLRVAIEWWGACAGLTVEEIRDRAAGIEPQGPVLPDFLTFRTEHFAYVDGRTGRWVRAANSWFQDDFVSRLDELRRGILVLPPGHVKTTMVMEYVVWSIFRDRDFRGLVVQRNTNEASKFVAAVQERLDHDFYHHAAERLEAQGDEPIGCPVCLYAADKPLKPDVRDRGARWGASSFRVQGREAGHKDDTLQAVGRGSQIMGIRSDLIVLDDVQSPDLAMHSPADSEELLDWFRTVILSRVYDFQRVIVLANFVSPDDFAHRLIDNYGDRWAVVTYPAIRPCDHPDCPGDYETCEHRGERILAPEVWSWEALMEKMSEVGERAWFYTWAQDEGSFEARTFTREALEAARTDDYRLGEVPAAVTDLFLGVDPAVAGSGVCAIVGWGLDRRTRQRYLVEIFAETGLRTFSNVTDEIVRMGSRIAQHAPLRSVVIEFNNVQGALVDDVRLRRELSSLGARIVPYQTRTGTGARAEQQSFDITHLGSLFEAGMIALPYGGTVAERERVDALVAEFLAWRTDEAGRSIKHLKRDRIMACLFAESEALRLATRARMDRPPMRDPRVPGWVLERRREREQAERLTRARRLLQAQADLPGAVVPGPWTVGEQLEREAREAATEAAETP